MTNKRTDNDRRDAQMGDLSPTKILRELRETQPVQPQQDGRR